MEILAPCGSEESFFSAIYNGADAMYLGLGDFNARAKATFFTTENIRDYVKIAHLFGVKIYITTNTLLKNEEIEPFIDFARKCVEAKVDAFIVQDLAVAKILRECFPTCELHASTQMGICNVAGAKIAKQLGFSRVVLARETKLDDIRAIKKQTGLEIEYFVQGALCVAFSGNCYLSALEHNKSGNRGKCLQLCRLPYSAYLGENFIGKGYLLSARDLCLIENLQELKQAGVDSLKIEGRLRRAGYVAQSVMSYRKAVDALTKNEKINLKREIFDLKKVFSRGEYNTRAYLDSGVPNNVINPQIQNHLGIEVGEILSTEPFKNLYKIKLTSTHPLHQNDGLKFLNNAGEEVASAGVGNVENLGKNTYIFYTKNRLQKGWKVYLTLDSENENQLIANTRKIWVSGKLNATINEPLKLSLFVVRDNQKIEVDFASEYIVPEAQNSPTSEQEILAQISKMNDTCFALENLEIVGDKNVFLPKSILNSIRRETLAKLQDKIITNHEKHLNITENTQNLEVLCSTMQCTMQSLNGDINDIYLINEDTDLEKIAPKANDILTLSPIIYTVQNVQNQFEKLSRFNCKFALNLPIIANEKDMQILTQIVENLPSKIYLIVNNISGLIFANKGHKIVAGLGLNIYNDLAVHELKNLGVDYFIFSKEFMPKNGDYITYSFGHQELMYFAHCPYKTPFQNDCKNCKFSKDLVLRGDDNKTYKIERTTISQCYFTLLSNRLTNKTKAIKNLIDLRFE